MRHCSQLPSTSRLVLLFLACCVVAGHCPTSAAPVYSSFQSFRTGREFNRQPQQYSRFSHVRLHNRTLYAYTDPASDVQPAEYPVRISLGAEDFITVKLRPWSAADGGEPFSECREWVQAPAVIYWACCGGNMFHYFMDAFGVAFPTLLQHDLLKHLDLTDAAEAPASFDLCDFQERITRAKAVGVTWQDAESHKWSFAMDYLFKARLFVDDAAGLCLEDVFLGAPITLQFFYEEYKDLGRRAATQQKLVWFLRHAAALEYLRNAQGEKTRIADVTCGAMPLSIVSRKKIATYVRSPNNRRAVRNERDILEYMQENYMVRLDRPYFKPISPWEAINLLQHTDLFFGMYGPHWANAYFMRPDAVVLLMLPHGWEPRAGKYMGYMDRYMRMVNSTGVRYMQWVNPHKRHAYHWKAAETEGGEEGPSNDTFVDLDPGKHGGLPWLTQQTHVDMQSFGPVLDAALEAAGVPRKAPKEGE